MEISIFLLNFDVHHTVKVMEYQQLITYSSANTDFRFAGFEKLHDFKFTPYIPFAIIPLRKCRGQVRAQNRGGYNSNETATEVIRQVIRINVRSMVIEV